MNKEFVSIIERMGYKVSIGPDSSPMIICDSNGNEVINKVYKILDENKRYILVNRFTCNNNQKINIYSNGIIDIKVNRGLSIILYYNEETKTYSIRLKVDYRNNKLSDLSEKNMIIDICHSMDNSEPGYVNVYENNLVNGEIIKKELGSLEQKRAYFVLNGKKNNIYAGKYTADNYTDAVLHIITSDSDVYSKKNLHDGVDLIIPVIYNRLDKLLTNWLDNLEVYRKRSMIEKMKKEEEIARLKKEIIQYNDDISIIDNEITITQSLKKCKINNNSYNMHLID